jgi:hypothetical protein
MNHADARKKTIAKPTNRISIRSSSSQMDAIKIHVKKVSKIPRTRWAGTKRRTAVRYGFDACHEYLSAFGAPDANLVSFDVGGVPLKKEARRRPSSGVLPRSIAVFE